MSLANYINIKSGLQDFFRPYSSTILPTQTSIEKITVTKFGGGMWIVWANLEIIASAQKLERDNVSVELGNIEREIMRMACTFKPGDIQDVDEMQYGGYERIYDNRDWSRTNWASKHFIRIRFYHSNDVIL